jgi:Kdo2-lipid IVA lauroyltransferase/acyltransferase
LKATQSEDERRTEAAMGEAATKAAAFPGGRRLGKAGRPMTILAALARKAETIAFWLLVAPLAARLPASLAYRVACRRGDWNFRHRAEERSEIVRNMRWVLGDELGPEEAEGLAREYFRMSSCRIIDVMRLRGRARSLGKLVEIRGREHLDAALAEGKGAILCTAHLGSDSSAFSLLHASGYPVTTIGFWAHTYHPMSSVERRFWHFVYARRLLRHRQRPMIEPMPGSIRAAAQAAVALRANEVVTISSDAAPLGADLPRTVEMPFLGRHARLLPGVVTLARLTDAPVLMIFIHRLADYRHQVMEISPPVPMQGETATAFGPCVAAMDAAIRTNLAHWFFWPRTDHLVNFGLLQGTSSAGTVAASPQPAVGERGAP